MLSLAVSGLRCGGGFKIQLTKGVLHIYHLCSSLLMRHRLNVADRDSLVIFKDVFVKVNITRPKEAPLTDNGGNGGYCTKLTVRLR